MPYLISIFPIIIHVISLIQVRGNYYVSVNQLGAGARWRRTTGQEIYSPFLLAFTHEVWLDCSSIAYHNRC
jgi:hypothetical protein